MSYDYEEAMGASTTCPAGQYLVAAGTRSERCIPRELPVRPSQPVSTVRPWTIPVPHVPLPIPGILAARWDVSADEIKAKVAAYQVGGPYHLIEWNSPDWKGFMQWAQVYHGGDRDKRLALSQLRPITQNTLDNIKQRTGEDITVPVWMKTGIKVLESEWRLYVESRDRALKMVRDQGVTPLAVSVNEFIEWWRKHDKAGLAGYVATIGGERGFRMGVPAGLYNFYLETGGVTEPPAHLLGKGLNLKAWLERNWMMLGLGAVGGVVVGGVVLRRRRLAQMGTPRGLASNPKERWQGTVSYRFDGSWTYDDIIMSIGKRFEAEGLSTGTDLSSYIRDLDYEFRDRAIAQEFVNEAKAAIKSAGATMVKGRVRKVTW